MNWLLDKALSSYVKSGEIRLTDHDGRTYVYGSPDGRFGSVAVRFADAGVARDILRDPGLGAAEAFMDGRLLIEQGDILDLVNIVRGSHRWEDSDGKANPFLRKRRQARPQAADAELAAERSRATSHHYDVGNDFYRLFLDTDLQYSCGYFTDPANSVEQAQLDKKTHVAAKLRLEPGMKVLDIGCGWGGLALYLNRVADVDVLGITLSEEQLKLARQRAEEAGRCGPGEVRADRLSRRHRAIRPDRLDRHARACRPAFYRTYFRKVRELLKPNGVAVVHTMAGWRPGHDRPVHAEASLPRRLPAPRCPRSSAASEQERLIMADCETWRIHYVHTLAAGTSG
jgi:cyclopropane-fatty-acyl-phospholipid synthase